MHWLPWTAETFARAARERKPVLLSISATWCRACHEMDRTTYADPAVQAFADARYVAVRVDTDERPDINDRYNLGGWPTTAFLTPDGALIGGGTYLDAVRMAGVLGQVADAFARLAIDAHAPVPRDVRRAGDTALTDVGATAPDASDVFVLFDEVFGGFGTEPKFPLTSPLRLAMALFRETPDLRYRFIVERTLDAIADGGLCDAASGGFYRYATTRDWQLPHVEKLLDTNARLLAAFVEAASTFGRDVDRARVHRLAGFIGSLASPDGGYTGSDSSKRVFAASTARAAGAMLSAAELLDDRTMAQITLRQFEAFLLPAYRPGGGIAHCVEAGERFTGLLADQIATGDASLAAYVLTGDEPYRMLAEELGHYTLRAFPAAGGGFVDRIVEDGDVGLLRDPRTPYFENCEAAAFFARLSRASGDAAFEGVAQGALDRARPAAAAHGPDAACWLLAAHDVAIR